MGVGRGKNFPSNELVAVSHANAKHRTSSDLFKGNDELLLSSAKPQLSPLIYGGPTLSDILDDVLLFSFFSDSAVLAHKGYGYGDREQIKVKVQSTTVPRETCEFAKDDLEQLVDNKLKESFFVGQVDSVSDDCDLAIGTWVTSLRRCAVKSRYVTSPWDSLITIPKKLDIGESVAVMSTFVPAMGMLHHGRVDRESRFSLKSLSGFDILVTGGGSEVADSVVDLALLLGANRVFVLQSKLSMATYHARSVRVELVGDEPTEWYPFIDRYMDLIVDLEYPKNFDSLYGILKESGRLVCQRPVESNSWLAPFEEWSNELSLLRYPNACMYHIDDQIENEHGEIVRDVRYLFRLLEQRRIRPNIDRYIMSADVTTFREHMKRNPSSGVVVCEPWRENT